MALKINDNYIKVVQITTSKEFAVCNISHSNNSIQKMYSFVPNLNSNDNFIKQAYLHLKSLEEYVDAEDC